MAIRLFNDSQMWPLDDMNPNAGGKITFYEPGTTTLKSVYTTVAVDVAHTNPVILDANGRPTDPIWLNGEYKYKVTTSGDVDVGLTIDNLNAETAAATVETGKEPPNGSFEIDTGGDGTPDSWTLAALTSATIAVDTTDSVHGVNSLKFTSGGNGGGTATSTRFDVLKGGSINVKWTHKSSSATALTKIDVKTYDKDSIIISTLSVYSEGAANPTSYTTSQRSVTADATAVTAEVVVTGVDASGTTKTNGTTNNVDNIEVALDSGVLTDAILDDNGNESLEFVTTASAINNPRFTNAATGNAAKLDCSETNSDLDFPRNGTGEITVDSTPIYGLVVLDTPVVVLTDTSTSATAQTAVDLSGNGSITGTAVKAILNVSIDVDGDSGTGNASEVGVGEGDETLVTLTHRAVYSVYDSGLHSDTNQVTVNLTSAEFFDYRIFNTGVAPAARTVKIYLAGYYI